MDPKRQKVKILKKYLKKSSWYIWKNPSQSSKKYRYLKSWDLIVTITGENFHKLLHLKWQCHKMVPLKCEKIIQKFTFLVFCVPFLRCHWLFKFENKNVNNKAGLDCLILNINMLRIRSTYLQINFVHIFISNAFFEWEVFFIESP